MEISLWEESREEIESPSITRCNQTTKGRLREKKLEAQVQH